MAENLLKFSLIYMLNIFFSKFVNISRFVFLIFMLILKRVFLLMEIIGMQTQMITSVRKNSVLGSNQMIKLLVGNMQKTSGLEIKKSLSN